MATRLTFLCAAPTPSLRAGGFPAPEEPAEEAALRRLADQPLDIGRCDRAAIAPSRAARETAGSLGIAADVDERLRDTGWGAWSGRGFAEVQAAAPNALAAWLASPGAAVPGGEAMDAVVARTAGWLAEQAAGSGAVLAITHAMVIRAALAAALDLPVAGVMRIDIAPLSLTRLSFHRGWRLQGLGGDGRRR